MEFLMQTIPTCHSTAIFITRRLESTVAWRLPLLALQAFAMEFNLAWTAQCLTASEPF